MSKKIVMAAVLAILATTGVPTASADNRDRSFGYYGWGPRVGLSVDPDQFLVGAHLDMGEPISHLRFQPNVEAGFGDNVTSIEFNAPLHYRFSDPIDVWSPYAGAELGWNFVSVDGGADSSDLGVKLVGGFERHIGDGNKFSLEAKVGLSDDVSDWKFLAGWTFVN